MRRHARYKDHEVGAGLIDPDRLGDRVAAVGRLLYRHDCGWLPPIAIALCVLSTVRDESIPDVLRWVAGCLSGLLG